MLPTFILKQLAHPSGLAAPLAGLVFNRANARMLENAVAALNLEPGQRVLDVGFGGGASLERLLAGVGDSGRVAGIDPSRELLRGARWRYKRAIDAGRLELRQAPVSAIPFPAGAFDAVLTSNTVYFWPDLDEGLLEIRRVLKPGGRFVLGFRPAAVQERLGFREMGHRIYQESTALADLERAGFVLSFLERPWDRNGVVLAIGRRGDV